MKTREQKNQQIKEGETLLKESKILFFVDFSGVGVEDLFLMRKMLRGFDAKLKVIKKKLIRIIFQKNGIDFNPEQFESQLGIIFSDRDISEIAGPVYKFYKDKDLAKKGFKILGAYDLLTKNFLEAETVIKIGQLPSREILLSQLIGVLSAPIRMLMYVLNEKSKMVDVINQQPTTNN